MTVKEYLKRTYREERFGILIRERAVCADGFNISIQAGRGIYSTPQRTLPDGEYTHVELGFPNELDKDLEEYREGMIYPYVPIEIAERVIKNHGGIVNE